MRRIIDFFLGNKLRLLFWCYLLLGIGLTGNHNLYFKSSYLNSSNQFSGSIHQFFSGIGDYFSLAAENEFLEIQNKRLLEKIATLENPHLNDTSEPLSKPFNYIRGQIIKNSVAVTDNYLTLSLGTKDSVFTDMGVVNEKGVLGIVEHSGSKFSIVQSILNSHSSINVKIKGTQYFGSLVWNGKDPNRVQLIDVPDLAPIKVGDTIATGGMASIFPENIPVGTIESFRLTEAKNYYLIQIRLFNDMQNIGAAYVIKNRFKENIQALESIINE